MANILELSKRPSDLLMEKNGTTEEPTSTFLSMSSKTLKKKLEQAPESNFKPVSHELVSDTNRRITLAGIVNERRNLGGTAHAEQFINELYSASQINRGPPGFSPSSRLHFDMLVGRDERIDFSDYLNFSRHQI